MNAVSGSWTLKVSSLDTESLFKATLVILVVAYLVTMVGLNVELFIHYSWTSFILAGAQEGRCQQWQQG